MNHQLNNTLRRYRWLTGLLAAMVVLMTVGGALGISLLRQGISHTASDCLRLEGELNKQKRENADLAARIATVHSPDFLIANMPDGLRPTRDEQVLWLRLNAPAPAPVLSEPLPEVAFTYPRLALNTRSDD